MSYGMSPFFNSEPTHLDNIVRASHHLVSNAASLGIARLFCHSTFCNIWSLQDILQWV